MFVFKNSGLRAIANLQEDQDLTPSTHVASHTYVQFQEDLKPSSNLHSSCTQVVYRLSDTLVHI